MRLRCRFWFHRWDRWTTPHEDLGLPAGTQRRQCRDCGISQYRKARIPWESEIETTL